MSIYCFKVGIKDIGNSFGPFLGAFGYNHACLLLDRDIFEYGSNSEQSYERHKNVGQDPSYDWLLLDALSGQTKVSPDKLERYIKDDASWYSGHYTFYDHNCHDFVKFCLGKIGCKSSMISKFLFCFKEQVDKPFSIQSFLGDKNLDVCERKIKNEGKIILFRAHNGINQIFTKLKHKDNTVSFIICERFAIDVKWGEAKNGAEIQVWEYNGTNAQKFYLKREIGGFYSIHSAINTDYIIDVENGNTEDGTKIQLCQ